MIFEIIQNGRKIIQQKSEKLYTLNTLSQYSISVSLQKGFNVTVSLLSPDRSIRLLSPYPKKAQEGVIRGEKELKFSFKAPNIAGRGAIDIFQTRKLIFNSKINNGKLDSFQLIEKVALKLESLKKCGLVLQPDTR